MRESLEQLLNALDAAPAALRRDPDSECLVNGHKVADHVIKGKAGAIYANGTGFTIYVTADGSSRRWGFIKKRLSFCQVTQDGDDEGCLYLDRLPTAEEAPLIREAINLYQRRRLSEEAKEKGRAQLALIRGGLGGLTSGKGKGNGDGR